MFGYVTMEMMRMGSCYIEQVAKTEQIMGEDVIDQPYHVLQNFHSASGSNHPRMEMWRERRGIIVQKCR